MTALVSEKGQVTIPKALRDGLGISAGTELEFTEDDGKLVARKIVAQDPFSKWRGKGRLPAGLKVDDYLDRVRGKR